MNLFVRNTNDEIELRDRRRFDFDFHEASATVRDEN